MLQIVGKDYKLTPVDVSSPFFNLELLYNVESKDGLKKKWMVDAYGVTLKNAIRRIASFRLYDTNQTMKLLDFVEKYKQEINNILHEVDVE